MKDFVTICMMGTAVLSLIAGLLLCSLTVTDSYVELRDWFAQKRRDRAAREYNRTHPASALEKLILDRQNLLKRGSE